MVGGWVLRRGQEGRGENRKEKGGGGSEGGRER